MAVSGNFLEKPLQGPGQLSSNPSSWLLESIHPNDSRVFLIKSGTFHMETQRPRIIVSLGKCQASTRGELLSRGKPEGSCKSSHLLYRSPASQPCSVYVEPITSPAFSSCFTLSSQTWNKPCSCSPPGLLSSPLSLPASFSHLYS